jgi:hypothetical protein|tara:strand:+ start:883 stop:1317 length:435 start_codon:yes stop_codon:yes gene_type:complete
MALHFAQLDSNNVVLQVISVGEDVPTANGPLVDNPKHVDGETYATTFGVGPWKQAFTDGTRKLFPSRDFTYDAVKDIFIREQPYGSWTLDSNSDWQPPITKPANLDEAIYNMEWDEENGRWIATNSVDSSAPDKIWNTNTNSWD